MGQKIKNDGCKDTKKPVATKTSKGSTLKIGRNKNPRAYRHVSVEERNRLIKMVREDGMRIKDSAKIIGINYSTAKHIIKHCDDFAQPKVNNSSPEKAEAQEEDEIVEDIE